MSDVRVVWQYQDVDKGFAQMAVQAPSLTMS